MFHYQPWMKDIKSGEYGTKVDYKNSANKKRLIAYYKDSYTGWIGVSCLVTEEIDRQAATVRNIIIFLMLCTIIAITSVVFIVITSLAKDLQRTNLFAQAVSCGNFEKKLRLNRNDELGSLCKALHRMVEVLKHTIFETAEKKRSFQEATQYLYTNIYEIDITADRFSPESNLKQFEQIDMEETSYSESLRYLAQKIQKDYQDNFLLTFSRKNILKEFKNNNIHLSIECPILLKNEDSYKWYRFDAHIFKLEGDGNIHIYLYSKNIDTEIENEIKAKIDELTGCLMRGAVEERVAQKLLHSPDRFYAFFILDIDNFKHANDNFGHAFGDYCLKQFATSIKQEFRKDDLIGRIGGDEFVVFISAPGASWVRQKAESLLRTLDMICKTDDGQLHITASIGIALYPADGIDYDTLYRNADSALYKSKEEGKNTFNFFDSTRMCSMPTKKMQ